MKLLQLPIVRGTLTIVATFMVVAGLGAVALAEDASDTSANDGFSNQVYVGLGAGISRIRPDAESNTISVGDPLSNGFSLAIGYDFASWLSVEVYGADLGTASVDFLGQEVGDIDYQLFGASVLGTFYRNGSSRARTGLSLYGRAGVGTILSDTELDFRRDNPQHIAFGVGAEYGFRNGFSVRGELNSYDTDAQLLQVSFIKRFGGQPNSRTRSVDPLPVVPVPPKEPTTPKVQVPTALPKTYFDFDQHTLTADAQSTVVNIASVLADIEGLIVVDGHADFTGSESYNQALSERRANAVRKLLIAEGIDANRVISRGYGESQPAASNNTSEGRAENRRVEVTLRAQ